MEHNSKSRIKILNKYANTAFVENCNGEWFLYAKEVLKNNSINLHVYAEAFCQYLKNGCQKQNIIMLVGPTSYGKSFLLDPLELIYKIFMNPSATSYAWVGLKECETAYLNDFHYTPECIKWSDFLLLLEGQIVNLPHPKNQFSSDLMILRGNTILFFATSKIPIEYIGKYNARGDLETEMMSSRWNIFCFKNQIPLEKIKNL